MEIRFENVHKHYGNTVAVKNLDLTIKNGSLHFLLGPSGCGKTTSLRMLAGLETVTKGRILFGDKDVTNMAASERNIGMVFQNYALWPHMTVRKNIEYGLKLRNLGSAEIQKRVQDVARFTQLEPFLARLPGQLSGGQQQRVALARALAIRPSVLLLDEPLSNLDAKLRLEMRDNITRIHRETGITTVYVTHDQKEALSMGTEITVMRAGLVMQSGTPRELYHLPKNSFIANFIGETNLVPGTVKKSSGSSCEVETAVGLINASRSVAHFKPGDKAYVSMRPESLSIVWNGSSPSSSSDNRLTMKLEHLTYLGELEQFHLKDAHDKVKIKVSAFNPPEHQLREGSQVICTIKPSDALVLSGDEHIDSGT